MEQAIGKGLTFEKVWAAIQVTNEQLKETDRMIKETGKQLKETDRIVKENAQRMKETDKQIKETDRQMKETDRQMKETDRRVGAGSAGVPGTKFLDKFLSKKQRLISLRKAPAYT
jgi:septal ring factor EnvC (AmiA/AmiB activator)